MLTVSQGDIAATNAVVLVAKFGIGDENPRVFAWTKVSSAAANRKNARLLSQRKLIVCRQHRKGLASGRSCELDAGARVDDVPCVDGRTHAGVVAGARQVEQPEPFHEERPLFAEKHREPLIHFHFKGVAFNLAEIGVDGGIERDS